MEGISNNFLLFGKWDTGDVMVTDPALKQHLNMKPTMLPHTAGRYTIRSMDKIRINIVERLINNIMRSGQGKRKLGGKYMRGRHACGKKHLAYNTVRMAFEIVEQKTQKNPMQVLVDALQNAIPREDVVRVKYGGVAYTRSVDVSAVRGLNMAIKNIALAAFSGSYRTGVPVEQALAMELISAAGNDPKSYAVSRKGQAERSGMSSR